MLFFVHIADAYQDITIKLSDNGSVKIVAGKLRIIGCDKKWKI